MNRRRFLQDAAIASAAVAASRWYAEADSADERISSISAVIYDERYDDCRGFAETFRQRGAAVFETNGDAAKLWYGALAAHLEHHPGGVAGMTTDADWGVSRVCGREVKLGVAYHGAHDQRFSDRMLHRLSGHGIQEGIRTQLTRGEATWSESIAKALDRGLRAGKPAPGSGGIHVEIAATTLTSATHPGYLTSWLLYPRA